MVLEPTLSVNDTHTNAVANDELKVNPQVFFLILVAISSDTSM